MNRIPKLMLVLIAALAVSGAFSTAAAQSKIGIFDAQAVSESTDMGKRIQSQLTTFTEGKEGEITRKQAKVVELRQELTAQSLSLSGQKRTALEKEIQMHLLELQSFQEAATRGLELEYATATREFREKLIVAVEAFGKEDGFALILDRSQIAWADTGIDVTSAIVDRFNRMFPEPEN